MVKAIAWYKLRYCSKLWTIRNRCSRSVRMHLKMSISPSYFNFCNNISKAISTPVRPTPALKVNDLTINFSKFNAHARSNNMKVKQIY